MQTIIFKTSDGERSFSVRYGVKSRGEIERGRKKSLWAAFTSAELDDQAAIVLAGIRHNKDARKFAIDDVIDLLNEHQGEYDEDILRPCFRELLESRPWGRDIQPHIVRRILGEDGESEGKADESRAASGAVLPEV